MYKEWKTIKGFQLCEFSIEKTNFGGIRKYSKTADLVYKKEHFAKKKCIDFYTSLYNTYYDNTEVKYIGTVDNNSFRGEQGTETEMAFFNTP